MSALTLPDQGEATRVVLVRHTEPVPEARGRCYGSSDHGLSEDGHRHAARIAAALNNLDVAAIVASPRRRALDTAAPIAAAHDIMVEQVSDLRELDFGDVEGQTYEEIARTRPEMWQAWMTRPTEVRFPGGESYADLRKRARRAAEGLRRTHRRQTSVVVTHGGVTRALLSAALELPDSKLFYFDQGYGAINVIDWFGDTPVIRLVNGSG